MRCPSRVVPACEVFNFFSEGGFTAFERRWDNPRAVAAPTKTFLGELQDVAEELFFLMADGVEARDLRAFVAGEKFLRVLQRVHLDVDLVEVFTVFVRYPTTLNRCCVWLH